MTVALLALIGCAKLPIVEPLGSIEVQHQFVFEVHDQSFMGIALVNIQQPDASLIALSPAGHSLFTITASPTTMEATAVSPGLEDVLRRLPFHRDLQLLYMYSCLGQPRCRVGGGRLREVRHNGSLVRQWRGPGGRADVEFTPQRASLHSRRGDYTLKVAGEGLGER
jgi:hypothetical protein